ncbi:MAG TPA: peptidoglycan-binding domain-containing protein [Acidimicrobiales bacterium]|nr:peptidoglycan-binding domain-containing protein [Acidimicrobiales bacterium]
MRVARLTVAILGFALVAAACGDDSSSTDPVSTAQTRVSRAQTEVTDAQTSLDAANQQLCSDAEDYVVAIDQYGKLFTNNKTTVGDIKNGGADLITPRTQVVSSAQAVDTAQSDLSNAQAELVSAQAALADAQAAAASVPPSATTAPAATTTTTIVAAETLNRVKQAEADFAAASAGITDSTPIVQAAVEFNSAAFALEASWLKLLSDAGCLTDEQQATAAQKLADYTVALQTELQAAGYYQDAIDGIYGPKTLAAVEQVQTEAGLPVTGLVDQATALALDKKAAGKALLQTTALQTVLKITGYWAGPVDGKWTPELTDALETFQTDLGVEPTGVIDPATMAAFEQAVEAAQSEPPAPTTTTTLPPSPVTTAVSSTQTSDTILGPGSS